MEVGSRQSAVGGFGRDRIGLIVDFLLSYNAVAPIVVAGCIAAVAQFFKKAHE